jgi:hypothetical protein
LRQPIAARNNCGYRAWFPLEPAWSETMKSLLLAGTVIVAMTAVGLTDGLYWVVGNSASNTCDIVTSNPIVDGNIWFADGPYNSADDAKLARSTIRECPRDQLSPANPK